MPHTLLKTSSPLWGRGFRPFFLMAAFFGVGAMSLWSLFWEADLSAFALQSNPIFWHAHEMVFGYALAVIAGFLLTAVANWTGWLPVREKHLMLLVGLWALGRVAFFFDPTSKWVMAADLLFLPALVLSLFVPLYRSWNVRNFVFLFMLAALWLCDLAALLTQELWPLHGAVGLICLMISVVGGRIIPAFTVGALRQKGINVRNIDQPQLDVFCAVSLVFVVLVLVLMGALPSVPAWLLSVAAFPSAVAHALRLRHYHVRYALLDPQVWILQLGYLWLVVGLFMLAGAGVSLVPFSVALHALTVGCLGCLTLGMMARVALAHTGRPLSFPKLTFLSLVLMVIAALVRVFGVWFWPEQTVLWVALAGGLWAISFASYLLIFTPVCFGPRPDGVAP